MRMIEGLDPNALDQVGWGLVFPAVLDPSEASSILKLLSPLLELRQRQAGRFFRIFSEREGVQPDEQAGQFLNRHGAGYGAVDPSQLPYYLLIAARPDQIPYEFQQRLSVQHAVGRVWFDTAEGWENYARTVTRAESIRDTRPAVVQIFCPLHPDDPFTTRLQTLVDPLADDLRSNLRNWQVRLQPHGQTRRQDLVSIFREDEARIVMLAGHSVRGDLVCAGWPGPSGPKKPPSRRNLFHAGSILTRTDLRGMVVINYSTNSLHPWTSDSPSAAQQLLGMTEGRGAQAVVGWAGTVWGPVTREWQARELAVFSNSLQRLASRGTVGYAFSLFSEQYAELVADLQTAWDDVEYGMKPDEVKLAELWAGMTTTRGMAIFGDPAVRAPAVHEPEPEKNLLSSLLTPAVPVKGVDITRSGALNALDLEIALTRRGIATYNAVMKVTSVSTGASATATGQVTLDFSRLQTNIDNAESYAASLTQQVFGDSVVREFTAQVLSLSRSVNQSLSIRIAINNDTPELHDVKWELLHDPLDGGALAATEGITFTRYLVSAGWSAVRITPRKELRVLAALFDPVDAEEYQISSGDMDLATQQISMMYPDMDLIILTGSSGRRASLQSFMEMMQSGVDVVHLLCAIRLNRSDGQPQLLLADDEGRTTIVSARMLSSMIKEIARPPRLFILHTEQPGVLAVHLAIVGVPSIIFLPERISDETATRWLAAFMDVLRGTNRVDLAASTARIALRDQGDNWMPILYTRMTDGRIFRDTAA